jgi:hypothetical protein
MKAKREKVEYADADVFDVVTKLKMDAVREQTPLMTLADNGEVILLAIAMPGGEAGFVTMTAADATQLSNDLRKLASKCR